MLDASQSNALVYSTLCGFMLVGLYAGYQTKTKTEFLSGLRTQSGTCGGVRDANSQRCRLR